VVEQGLEDPNEMGSSNQYFKSTSSGDDKRCLLEFFLSRKWSN